MEQCPKCKSSDTYTRHYKTSKNKQAKVLHCRRCRSEVRAVLIVQGEEETRFTENV